MGRPPKVREAEDTSAAEEPNTDITLGPVEHATPEKAADPVEAPKAEPPMKLVPKDTRLPSSRAVKGASHVRRHLFVQLPAGTQPAELLNSRYWTHHARDFAPMDLVETFCEDGLWEGTFRVLFVGQTEVRVSPVSITHHDAVQAENSESPYYVRWVGAATKYGVFRRDNNALVKDGFFPVSVAYAYMQQHLAEMRQ